MFALINLYYIWIALHLIFCDAARYLIIGWFPRISFKFKTVWVYSMHPTIINIHFSLLKVWQWYVSYICFAAQCLHVQIHLEI